jgi:hypothetical protein
VTDRDARKARWFVMTQDAQTPAAIWRLPLQRREALIVRRYLDSIFPRQTGSPIGC